MSVLKKVSIPSARSIALYLSGFACLVLTALMNRHAGESQGATESGRMLLGYSAMVIDFAGLVVFGSIAGGLFAQNKKVIGSVVLAITLGCAAYSITSIMGFVGSEWLSVEESRKMHERRAQEQHAAQLAAAKLRQETQARLAEQHLKQIQGTTVQGSGSQKERRAQQRELRKDQNTAALDLITKMGQQVDAAPAPEKSEEITIRPNARTEALSILTGLSERTITVLLMAGVAVLLILIKLVAFPLGGYYWSRKSVIHDAMVLEGRFNRSVESTMAALPAPAAVAPQIAQAPVALVAEPAPVAPPKAKAPPVPAMPEEWRDLLTAIGYPDGKWAGPLRKREDLDAHALRWFTWLLAHKHVGEITGEALDKLHADFVGGDHRDAPWKVMQAKGALSKLKWVTKRSYAAPTTWTITGITPVRLREVLIRKKVVEAEATTAPAKKPAKAPPTVEEAVPAPQKAQQTQGGGTVVEGPFAGAALVAAVANDDAPKAPVVVPRRAAQGLLPYRPDMEAMRRLSREQKAMWQAKRWTMHRKQQNRMSRVRAA
jgi:hypothetical protein